MLRRPSGGHRAGAGCKACFTQPKPLSLGLHPPAEKAGARKSKAPGLLSGTGDANALADRDLYFLFLLQDLKRRLIQPQPIVSNAHAKSLAQAAWARAEQA